MANIAHHDLLELATNYHKALPGRIHRYRNERGISDLLIDFHLLGWNGNRITLPIFNCAGELAFFKLARDPEDKVPGPKMPGPPGAYAELYGWEVVLTHRHTSSSARGNLTGCYWKGRAS